MENMQRDYISARSVTTPRVNNTTNSNFEIFRFFYLHYMGWIKPKSHLTLQTLEGHGVLMML